VRLKVLITINRTLIKEEQTTLFTAETSQYPASSRTL